MIREDNYLFVVYKLIAYLSWVFFSGLTILEIFIPILVSFLLDDIKTTSTAERSLHDDSLQRLMKIGPQYPEEFRSIMAGQSILKTKLESAIKLGHLQFIHFPFDLTDRYFHYQWNDKILKNIDQCDITL